MNGLPRPYGNKQERLVGEAVRGWRVVVTGGAGFLGSHLCTRLLDEGAEVVALDNLITGSMDNLSHLMGREGFRFVHYDVTDFVHVPGPVDAILHFASPASPIDYLELPIQTLKVGALGTHKALGMARATGARLLLASTSEVYGDPQVHPQPETYWGHVNPIGPRGVYDEAKRYAEAMTYAYHRAHGVDVRVARIFNSLLADQKVLHDDGSQLRHETFAQLAARVGDRVALEGHVVPGATASGEAVIAAAIALEGHPPTGPCFEVRTRYGRAIRVTGDHSLFVRSHDGHLAAKPVSELQIGDHVAIAGRIQVPERDLQVVDVLRLLDDRDVDPWKIRIGYKGLSELLDARRRDCVDVLMARDGRGSRRSLGGSVSRCVAKGSAPLGLVLQLSLPIDEDARVGLWTAGRSTSLPRHLPVSDELLWFLGLFVAEGSLHERRPKTSVMVVSCDDDLLDKAEKILRRDLGVHVGRAKSTSSRTGALRINSVILLHVLRALGFTQGEKSIPSWVLGLPLGRLKWFMEGYREGDGVHSGLKLDAQRRHEFSTTSRALRDDLIVALGRFGLVPSVGYYHTRNTARDEPGTRRPFWRLTISHVSPWSPLDWDQGVQQRLNARRTGDVVWAKVHSVVETEPTDLVYDFSVPGIENFYGGDGFVAHNTYGERMRPDDGRAVPTFLSQALRGAPLTIHGDGSQTRSLSYVDDLIEGILRLLISDYTQPVNLGNPHEVTVRQLAELIIDLAGSASALQLVERPQDDPQVRRPDTAVAKRELDWQPQVPLAEGLERTLTWFRDHVDVARLT